VQAPRFEEPAQSELKESLFAVVAILLTIAAVLAFDLTREALVGFILAAVVVIQVLHLLWEKFCKWSA
jgi:uncharacterized membrane protein